MSQLNLNPINIGNSKATTQAANSIIINATASELTTAVAGCIIAPIRSVAGTTPLVLAYDTTTKEVIATTGVLPPANSTVATTDATPTTLATIAIASNTAVTINGIVAARNSSGTINNTTGGRFTCTAVNTAGTVALAATPDVTVQATSTGTFNVVVSGTNLIVQVTGIAATPYTWSTVYTTLAL
jgi:hypothetical protein